jgi:hypothetical protein
MSAWQGKWIETQVHYKKKLLIIIDRLKQQFRIDFFRIFNIILQNMG